MSSLLCLSTSRYCTQGHLNSLVSHSIESHKDQRLQSERPKSKVQKVILNKHIKQQRITTYYHCQVYIRVYE